MRRLVMELKDEISAGGPLGPTTGTTPKQGKARVAGGEVGAVHSSDEGGNDAGAKGPYSVDVNSEAWDCAMAPFGEIATARKIQMFQRTLCRGAKKETSIAAAVNDPGKPDAGNPPVRFDEGWGVLSSTDNYGRFNLRSGHSAYSTPESCNHAKP